MLSYPIIVQKLQQVKRTAQYIGDATRLTWRFAGSPLKHTRAVPKKEVFINAITQAGALDGDPVEYGFKVLKAVTFTTRPFVLQSLKSSKIELTHAINAKPLVLHHTHDFKSSKSPKPLTSRQLKKKAIRKILHL